MVTKILDTSTLNADSIYSALQVLIRMGWAYDFNGDESNGFIVNVPIADEHIFDFIFEEYI